VFCPPISDEGKDTSDTNVIHHMATAAFCCLKRVKGHKLSMSEVRLYIVDQ
jgi:hypothetical protein